MAGAFSRNDLQSQCEDCGCPETTLNYHVIERKKLCSGCVSRRASKVLDSVSMPPDALGTQEGKILSLKCEHCTAGICDTCETIVKRNLGKLQLENWSPPRDIQKKRLSQKRRLEVPKDIKFPRLCCGVGKNKLAVVDTDSGSLFLYDMGSCKAREIVPATEEMAVSDCTVVNRNELLLGNLADGSLHICNLEGKVLGVLPLPGQKAMKRISLGTNKLDQVVAAREADVFLCDTLAGKIIGEFCLGAKPVLRNIQVTSSSMAVVQTDWAEFTLCDLSSGSQHTHDAIRDDSWFQAVCTVHPTKDLLYVLYSRKGEDPARIHVDEVTTRGEIKRKGLFSFKTTGPLTPPIINSNMELIICDGRSILVCD